MLYQTGQPVRASPPVLFGNQVPPVSKYSGNADSEPFEEWLEQFELVASVCNWEGRAKLANLVTRLQGQAYSFYRTCSTQQRTSYDSLKNALAKRFKPVRIQSVQSGLFHERRQKPQETVEDYAQDLNRLYQRAYPQSERGSEEAERMGQTVLAYKFAAGLKPEIRVKVAGTEGSFEQLLMRARFEEAKLRDLQPIPVNRGLRQTEAVVPNSTNSSSMAPWQTQQRSQPKRCFICNQQGHLAKQCPQQRRGRPVEAQVPSEGNRKNTRSATYCITQADKHDELSVAKGKVADLKRQLQTAELQEALLSKTATINGLWSAEKKGDPSLGSTISVEVVLEGRPTKALVDTGSPVTIVSIDCLLEALFERCTTNQSPEDWRKEVAAKIQPPSLTIRSYGGGEINVIGQLSVIMSVGERKCQQTVLVQKGASVDLLLGTDTLPCLGFHLLLRPHEDKLTIDMMTSKEMETAVGKQDTGCLEVPPTVVPKQNSNPSGDMNLERTLNLTLGDTDDNLNTHCKDKIEVKLLTATRLPGRQAKVLRAQVSNTLGVKDVVFEPYEFLSDDQKLVMTEALIEPNKEGYVKLLIENHESHPVFLEAGTMLGQLQAVQIINNDKVPEVLHLRVEDPNLVEETMPEPPSTPTERSQQLLDRINVAWNAISAEEGYELKSLIDEYNDVFAIDPMEVGRTDLVQHRIDTGGQTPLRQPPRRIPFSLRAKVEKMV